MGITVGTAVSRVVHDGDAPCIRPATSDSGSEYLGVRGIISSVAHSAIHLSPLPEVDLSALADELLSTMASIRRSGRLVGRPAELAGLTGAQLDLVRTVRRRPGISVAEAAAELRLAPNTVSTLVRQLTDTRMLLRSADDTDRRVARLTLTPDMAEKVGRFRDRRLALLTTAFAELRPAERRRLETAVGLLQQVAARLPDLVAPDA